MLVRSCLVVLPTAMTALWLTLGLAIVSWALIDALWTTLWAEGGAGPMTYLVDSSLWEMGRRVARWGGDEFAHRRLSIAGPVIMATTIGVWVLLLWVGFLFVFCSHEMAVLDATSRQPVGLSDRLWYTLYSTTTLGNGDLAPGTTLAQVLSGLAATSGLVLLTLSLSYTMSVVDSVNQKRALAGDIFGVGGSIGGTLEMMKAGDRGGIENRLADISARIVAVARQHEAYPIVHFFHPLVTRKSAVCAIAQLDETLNLFESEAEERQEDFIRTTVDPTRRAITNFLETVEQLYVSKRLGPPELPDADRIQRAGVDMTREDVERAIDPAADRRQLLATLVEKDGWSWNQVIYQQQQSAL